MRQKRCVDCIQGTILGHVWWYGMPMVFYVHLLSFYERWSLWFKKPSTNFFLILIVIAYHQYSHSQLFSNPILNKNVLFHNLLLVKQHCATIWSFRNKHKVVELVFAMEFNPYFLNVVVWSLSASRVGNLTLILFFFILSKWYVNVNKVDMLYIFILRFCALISSK